MNWFAENWGTLLVSIVLFGSAAAIIIKLRRDKKQGKTSCGCGCEHCSGACGCHQK